MGHVEVQDPPPPMLDDEEAVERLEGKRPRDDAVHIHE
jgi:hypothetical protein